jgi:two-component system, NtrC family, sensor kinase
MKGFLIFIILFISATAYGQDTIRVQRATLDSLSTLVSKHKTKDTIRIQLLNDYARLCLYDQDFLEGLKALNEARSLSKSLSHTRGEGFYFINLSIFNQFAISVADRRLRIELNDHLAVYHHIIGNTILHRNSSFNVFGSISIPVSARIQGKDSIIARLKKALEYFESQNIPEITANIHIALALNTSTSDKTKSDKHARLAQELFRQLGQSHPELILMLNKIGELWREEQDEEAKQYELEVVNKYTHESDKFIKALSAARIGRAYAYSDRPILGLEYLFQSADLLKELNERDILRSVYLAIASVYEWSLHNSEKALEYGQYALDLRKELGYYEGVEYDYLIVTTSLIGLHRINEFPIEYKDHLKTRAGSMTWGETWFDAEVQWVLGQALDAQGNDKEALRAFKEAIRIYLYLNDYKGGSSATLLLAKVYKKTGDMANAREFALKAFDLASKSFSTDTQIEASNLLSELYEQSGEYLKAYENLKVSRKLKAKYDALNNATRLSELEVQSVLKKRQQEIETLENESLLRQQENKTQRLWIFSIAGALISVIALAAILYRNSKQKEQTNKSLGEALSHLKSTQSQLIHSEKMASLGELTAGIAHEIQNPLNFVNNFSEVNKELLLEMNDEIIKGNFYDVKEIAKNVIDNEEKIIFHGKRADGIVKGMLQHSRSSSGVKEPTDINVLADEYLRLAYHGLRAKDKSFNATMKTDFDDSLGTINVVPQDIGRVILNLITNAFYAVTESKTLRQAQGDRSYEPTVSVSTKNEGDKVLISVKDNGNGIPEKVLDKIFQPFFTTKPTGQGTGLGLSLSYDIVKAHGGELKVVTKEGVGTEFLINLSIHVV